MEVAVQKHWNMSL